MTIKATIVADSISPDNNRITTFELEYPRFIHAELMTHRVFSRNAASSRAIPVEKMMEQVSNTPAKPIEWGKNQAGMQAKEIFSSPSEVASAEYLWLQAAKSAVASAKQLKDFGLHKQIVNRILEPFQIMKTIVTATEYDNFFWLRCHTDAQPEIHALADLMFEAYTNNNPQQLFSGEWHLPYFECHSSDGMWSSGDIYANGEGVSLEEAKKISASCCAQVSYRKLDDSLDKALKIYDQLANMTPVHASPFEHQATPLGLSNCVGVGYEGRRSVWPEGITHMDRNADTWSGNFKGWIQSRQTIPGHVCDDFPQ